LLVHEQLWCAVRPRLVVSFAALSRRIYAPGERITQVFSVVCATPLHRFAFPNHEKLRQRAASYRRAAS
jgi:hypothetical protein